MSVSVVQFNNDDLPQMIRIWNEVVEEGIAFPQEQVLNPHSGKGFFAAQTYCAVAKNNYGDVLGLYILHPNNVGRCGHICNASYAVSKDSRGHHIGEKLVVDSLKQAKHQGFRIMQFNAVVESNVNARHLYEKLGFVHIGIIPDGFRMKDGSYTSICQYYRTL
ncbi:MAG: GNAT family N-acetyltransferase [Ruminococcus sp.]|nr:GNAT family N-acetyltransferase [Ruminococcus sp.]